MISSVIRTCAFLLTAVSIIAAQTDPDWTEPFPAHKIADNLYYVGSKSLASYLISTPKGHILINSSLEHFHVNCNQLWKFSADANAEDVFR